MTEERDETIERVTALLSPLPEVDPSARARVRVAVAAERERDRVAMITGRRRRRLSLGAAGVAAAVLATLWLSGHGVVDRPGATAHAVQRTTEATPSAAALATRDDATAASARPVQLVFRAPTARRVSVVGDFTGWDAHPGEMTRDSASGLWNVTLALTPGRHVYAFLVDDSLWVRDPRAPLAADADFGRPGSVLFVGRP